MSSRSAIRSVSPSMLVCRAQQFNHSPSSVRLCDSYQQTELHKHWAGSFSTGGGGQRALTGGRGIDGAGDAAVACAVPMRRTTSLDTVLSQQQLAARDRELQFVPTLLVDRATQTPEEWVGARRSSPLDSPASLLSPNSSDHLEKKLIRQWLQRNGRELSAALCHQLRRSPVPADHSLTALLTAAPAPAASCQLGPARAPRSSVEALNQEIERLVQQRALVAGRQTPVDGHLAPVDEMLMCSHSSGRRSVNTQTPVDDRLLLSPIATPLAPDSVLSGGGGSSKCSTPELELYRQSSSPQSRFVAAIAPPVGCERVRLRAAAAAGEDGAAGGEEATVGRRAPSSLDELVIKPAVFELKPSLCSAFTRPPFRKRASSDDAAATAVGVNSPPAIVLDTSISPQSALRAQLS